MTNLISSDPAGSDITFAWQDYFDTNRSVNSYGELGQQSAKIYRIRVDNEPSFAPPLLDEAIVDQATFTSGDRLYPEGTLFWRVRAIDAQDNTLTRSSTASLTKASPNVVQTSPISGQARPGTVALEWQPQAFASGYEVEVYANNDAGFSAANRIIRARVANPAYTPTEPIPASATPYIWRVRRPGLEEQSGPVERSQGSYPSALRRNSSPPVMGRSKAAFPATWSGAMSQCHQLSGIPANRLRDQSGHSHGRDCSRPVRTRDCYVHVAGHGR
ncbi:hypothetical protein [Nocardioides sp. B-3]|uniref:hypothetical protein n=1 Tax=Nocardioides sp. B-3 TaxID=2895565 RepID=UPI002152A481|nr:hypothetical protein [Nocardioides sp. B-3]UUZ59730.1 hypothetical protein LP418_00955 [Nocardioides sp. B-3]